MVYLRSKRTRSDSYLYLVKSVWDKKKNTSKQEIIKYLGKASEVGREDIPSDYKDDPKIIAALALHSPNSIKIRERLIKKSRQVLRQCLLAGDIKRSEKAYKDYTKTSSIGDFFEKILRPIMYKIGDDWKAGRVSIASEHVASNTAQTLIRGITCRTPDDSAKGKVLICVPMGEEHHLGCDMLEVFFSTKGLKVFNMSAPLPTRSILSFIEENRPDCVLVSVTLEENLSACQRLVKKIHSQRNIPVFVGGHALQSERIPSFQAEIIPDMNFEHILRKVRRAVGGQNA